MLGGVEAGAIPALPGNVPFHYVIRMLGGVEAGAIPALPGNVHFD
jgi:hypothetical protein